MALFAPYNGTDTSSPRIGSIAKNAVTAVALEGLSFDEERLHGKGIVDWMAFSSEGSIFVAVTATPDPIAQAGAGSVDGAGVSINFASSCLNPMVIVTITSTNAANAANAVVARVSNATSTGFEVRLRQANCADGVHGAEDISWIAFTGVGEILGRCPRLAATQAGATA
jgi:mRNA-degrading endonuclease toxin of MazEF toxin-antitoxin module